MKKIISLVLVLVLALTAIGGTLAYFTDTDSADNVFTVGDVNIELHEKGVIENEEVKDEAYREALADIEAMPGVNIDKEVWVDNTGSQPAYIRVVMTIDEDIVPTWRGGSIEANSTLAQKWNITTKTEGTATIYTFELKNPLEPGATTENILTDIMLNANITNVTSNTNYEIPIKVYAIQSAGFETAEAAYAELSKEGVAIENENIVDPIVVAGAQQNIILTENDIKASGYDGAIWAKGSANVTIEGDGNVIAIGDKNGGNAEYAIAVFAEGANTFVTINGGYYTQSVSGNDSGYDLIYAKDNATITINGGTFKSVTPQWTLNLKDGTNAKIVVKGGTFYKYDPSQAATEPGQPEVTQNFVATGYKVVQDGDWYTVVKA